VAVGLSIGAGRRKIDQFNQSQDVVSNRSVRMRRWVPKGLTHSDLQTEYRYASYRAVDIPVINTNFPSIPTNLAINSRVFVQTVRTEVVYRFNWGH
jgi:hypothetical protein